MDTPPRRAAAPPANLIERDRGGGVRPIPAEHGSACICRSCAATYYRDALERADRLQQELSVAQDELRVANHAVSVARYYRLTAEIELAIVRKDEAAYWIATAERMNLGISLIDVEAA